MYENGLKYNSKKWHDARMWPESAVRHRTVVSHYRVYEMTCLILTIYCRDHTEHQIMQLLHIHGLWCHTLPSWLAHGHAIMQELFSALRLCETVCVSSSDWISPKQIEVRLRETLFFFFLDLMRKIIHLQSLGRQWKCSFFCCFVLNILWICF